MIRKPSFEIKIYTSTCNLFSKFLHTKEEDAEATSIVNGTCKNLEIAEKKADLLKKQFEYLGNDYKIEKIVSTLKSLQNLNKTYENCKNFETPDEALCLLPFELAGWNIVSKNLPYIQITLNEMGINFNKNDEKAVKNTYNKCVLNYLNAYHIENKLDLNKFLLNIDKTKNYMNSYMKTIAINISNMNYPEKFYEELGKYPRWK